MIPDVPEMFHVKHSSGWRAWKHKCFMDSLG